MNRDSKLFKEYLGAHYEYFNQQGNIQTITTFKGSNFIINSYHKKLHLDAKKLLFHLDVNDEAMFMQRVKETFTVQQTFELSDNHKDNLFKLKNVMKKHLTILNFIQEHSRYSKIVSTHSKFLQKQSESISVSSFVNEPSSKVVTNFCSAFQDIDLPESELLVVNLTDEEKLIHEKLQLLAHTILLFFIETTTTNILVYGSYSLHLIKDTIKYNDIDVYCSDPSQIATVISFLAYWIFDVVINIHLNPLILFYIAIEYKSSHVLDVLYLHKEAQAMYKIMRRNVAILKPSIQFFNFFRSLTDFHRMKIFQTDRVNSEEKLNTIISYVARQNNLKLQNLQATSSLKHWLGNTKSYLTEDLRYIILPKTIFSFDIGYDYIFIFIGNPKEIANALPSDTTFYKRHSGVYNELVAAVPKNADMTKSVIITSLITINNTDIIPVAKNIKTLDLGKDFETKIKSNNILVLSNSYSKLFIDKNTDTLEPISFFNILASLGLAMTLNELIPPKHERIFIRDIFALMNIFTIEGTVKKLKDNSLEITQKKRTRQQHKNFQLVTHMTSQFSLYFAEPNNKTKKIFTKSECLNHLS